MDDCGGNAVAHQNENGEDGSPDSKNQSASSPQKDLLVAIRIGLLL